MNQDLIDAVLAYLEEQKLRAWNTAEPVPGLPPGKYRRDPSGHIMRYPDFGKPGKIGSWTLDSRKRPVYYAQDQGLS